MTRPWWARPALLVSMAVAGVVFGAGSLLPLWWVPSWGLSDFRRPWDRPGVLLRSGPLWDAVVGMARLPQLGDRHWWVYENLVLTLVLLVVSLVAGLVCYWVILTVASPEPILSALRATDNTRPLPGHGPIPRPPGARW